jgi:hypothetical protein
MRSVVDEPAVHFCESLFASGRRGQHSFVALVAGCDRELQHAFVLRGSFAIEVNWAAPEPCKLDHPFSTLLRSDGRAQKRASDSNRTY